MSAVVGLLALAAAAYLALGDRGGRRTASASAPVAVEASRYVILPFEQHGVGVVLSADDSEHLLRLAFERRWTGIRVVDPFLVGGAIARDGRTRTTVPERIAVARRLRARMTVWGEVRVLRGVTTVRAVLYDVLHADAAASSGAVELSSGREELESTFAHLASTLVSSQALSESGAMPLADADAGATRVPDALRLYARAHHALREWDFAQAIDSRTAAVALDSSFAIAHLWLAEVASWVPDQEERARRSARRAVALTERLSSRDATRARALLALLSTRFPEACSAYRSLIGSDSSDFRAWHGLAECQALDDAVVPDPSGRSPSGRIFRSSYDAATRAYQRALQLVPSAIPLAQRGIAFTQLARLLKTDPSQLRVGSGADGRYAAFPSLHSAAETVAYSPVPLRDVQAGREGTEPPTHMAALDHNRRVWRAIAALWQRTFPDSPEANAALADALERSGELTGSADVPPALTLTERASRLARRGSGAAKPDAIDPPCGTRPTRSRRQPHAESHSRQSDPLANDPCRPLRDRPVRSCGTRGSCATLVRSRPRRSPGCARRGGHLDRRRPAQLSDARVLLRREAAEAAPETDRLHHLE